eukprot:s2766_g1.t1
MREQEFEQRLQEAESGSIVAKAEYQKLSSEAIQALENAKASLVRLQLSNFRLRLFDVDQAIENERARLAAEFETSINQTIEHAKSSVEGLRKEYDDKVAVQARYIQVKAEFEKYKAEIGEKLSEAEAQNLSLQDTIDDLQEQLDILKKRVHETAATGNGAPAAWAWLNEVYDQSCTRTELEKKLQDPGKFLTLDTKLSAALTRSAGGDLATRILNFKENQAKKGIQTRGSESDLVSKGMLKDVNAKNCRPADHPISLITANGSTEANEVADVKLSALPDTVQPYVLDQTPAVLSVGTRFGEEFPALSIPFGAKAPKPDRLEDQVIPPIADAVPLESEMQAPVDDALEYSPGSPLEAAGDGEPAEPAEPIFHDIRLTPKGEVIPDGHHWDGHRIVRNYKGSKRPAGIDSTLWKMLGSNERQQIIAEEEAKAKAQAEAQGGS